MVDSTKNQVPVYERSARTEVDVRMLREPPEAAVAPESIRTLAESLAPAFYVDVGNVCNQNCVYCSVERNQLYKTRQEDAVAGGEAALAHGFGTCVFIGGEPTIWGPLLPTLDVLNEKGLHGAVLTTNGLMLSYLEFVERLAERQVHTVAFSLDDWSPQTQRNLARRDDVPPLLSEAIDNLADQPMTTYFYAVVTRHLVGRGGKFNRWLRDRTQQYQKQPYLLLAGLKPVERAHKHYDQLAVSLTETAQVAKQALDQPDALPVAFRDIPLCLMPEHLGHSMDVYHRHGSLDLESGEIRPAALARDRGWARQCERCALKEWCPAIYQRYLDRFGDHEFHPF